MKETNLLENQLRSWQPRRPSARLKRRIFGAAPIIRLVATWSLRRLAPAAACLLAALVVFNHDGSISSGPARHDFLVGMIGSNQTACLPANYQQERNHSARVTFEWTNAAGSTSSIGSFLRDRVN